jgi:hypothetical protein
VTSPEKIRASLAGLAEAARAARARPVTHTLTILGQLLDGFRGQGSAWRLALEKELPDATGFSPDMVRAGLELALEPLSGEALAELVDAELGGVRGLDGSGGRLFSGFDTTGVVLAGALPMTTLLGVSLPLVLRSGVLAKPSVHDGVSVRHVARALGEVDPELAACLAVASFPGEDAACADAFCQADCLVVNGSDATIEAVSRRVKPPRRLVPYGHRISLAAIGPEATRGPRLDAVARDLATDVALWDQLGCLSPVAVFVVGDAAAPDRLADALAGSLAAAGERWPRGPLLRSEAAGIARERDEAEFRSAAGGRVRVLCSRGSDWTVVRESDAGLRPAPLHRFVRVHPCSDAPDLMRAVAPLGARLAGVALAGFAAEEAPLAARLARLGASRICRPGRLQAPPLDWRRDNVPVLLPLAKCSALELDTPEGTS